MALCMLHNWVRSRWADMAFWYRSAKAGSRWESVLDTGPASGYNARIVLFQVD